MAASQKKGGGSAKIGRNRRAASNTNQPLRTARNKRLRIEREARRQANPKRMKKARGGTRRVRRYGMRQAKAREVVLLLQAVGATG